MILVLGGTKSGKTGFAERTAEAYSQKHNCPVVYLATAQAWDEEMKIRIRRHQESRPDHWITFEEPRDILSVFESDALQQNTVVLLDCLTMWITNLLMDLGEDLTKEEAEEAVLSKLTGFLKRASSYKGEVIIVSNLVEVGLISPHFLGRTFQDLAGKSHQMIAAAAQEVYQITAGLALKLK